MSYQAVKLARKAFAPKARKASTDAAGAAAGQIYIAHGLLGNSQNWGTPSTILAEAPELQPKLRQILALDMRNHGQSPHSANHSNAALASDLEAVVLSEQHALQRELGGVAGAGSGGRNAVLMGHSMGGFAVMGSLLRRYNEALLLPEDPLEGAAGGGPFDRKFGTHWDPARRHETSRAMRSLNAAYTFAETQPIRDVLFSDEANLTAADRDATSAIATRVPALGRVAAAVIVDMTPTEKLGVQRTGDDSVAQTLERMTAVQLDRIKSYSDAGAELLRVGMTDKGMRDFVLTNFVIDSSGATPTRWRCNLEVLHEQYGSFTPSIANWFLDTAAGSSGFVAPRPCTLPTLFVFGADSPYNTADTRALITTFFPNSTQVAVEGAGHFVHYQKPKEFVKIVAPFIAEHM